MAYNTTATAFASSSSAASSASTHFDIFINHRGPDTKNTIAANLYRSLTDLGLLVFLDRPALEAGKRISPQIEAAIKVASVHIAIFSENYANSKWCLDELRLMVDSEKRGATILPVFYKVKPADLRWDTDSKYAEALRKHEEKRRYDPQRIQGWRDALFQVSTISGFELEACNGDEAKLSEKIVQGVLLSTLPDCNDTPRFIIPAIDLAITIRILRMFQLIRSFTNTLQSKHATVPHDTLPYTSYDVFIAYRVRDFNQTLALPLYQSLQSRGLRVFLDRTEMVVGPNIYEQIVSATRAASVHIALLSPNYAESAFCLDQLVLMVNSGAIILPVFHDVDPCELVCTGRYRTGAYAEALRAHEETQLYDSERIQEWRDALGHVADISGVERRAFNREVELLQKVVQEVLNFFPGV